MFNPKRGMSSMPTFSGNGDEAGNFLDQFIQFGNFLNGMTPSSCMPFHWHCLTLQMCGITH